MVRAFALCPMMRRPESRVCRWCRGAFLTTRKDLVLCSAACGRAYHVPRRGAAPALPGLTRREAALRAWARRKKMAILAANSQYRAAKRKMYGWAA